MNISYKKVSDHLKIFMVQEPDTNDFESLIKIYNETKPVKKVFLDLKNCFYIQSKNIAQLIAFKKTLSKDNVPLILLNLKESVIQVLEITNLLPQFTIQKDYSSYTADELIEAFFDPEIADEVSDFISQNYCEEYKEKLFDALKSEDPVLLEYAIITLGKVHEYDIEELIPQFMNFEVANVQKAAILVAGWLGIYSLKEKIYDFLKSEFIDVAEAAAASISLLSDESDSDKLKDLLESKDERIRKIAAKALSLINDDKSYQFLKNSISKESNESVRAVMVKSLSLFNKPDVADLLIALLKDNSEVVREAAAASLSRINAVGKIDKIMEFCQDKDEMVSFFAIKALGSICKDINCADKLMHIYPGSSTRIKAAIIEALGNIGIDVSDFLYQALDEENEDLRKEALNSLFMINKKMAVTSSKELILKDKSWVVRFKATEILEGEPIESVRDIFKSALDKESNRYVKEKLISLVGDI
ncbi:MAG: hypothetical protein JG767_933 [Deferribacteraceae bacterium]|jgi:anti-anti-sigma factor|nr:hypothetical protein [Deferribacteraceae bacterium]